MISAEDKVKEYEHYSYERPASTGQFTGLPAQQRNDPALRFDANKLRYELLPADGLEELVKVYTEGARKYEDNNWTKGMAWSRVFGSLLRHAWAFWKGEIHDPETGCHHMAMAAWNCIALCVYDLRKAGEDNRPTIKTEK